MTPPQSLLVATDLSDTSAGALEYGRGLARALRATLHVLHVADELLKRYMRSGKVDLPPELQANIENGAQSELEHLITNEDRRDLRAIAAVRISADAADAIVGYARTAGIDLIVIGSHGRRGLSHALLGSVAEHVARTAPCPVLIVRASGRAQANAVLPSDQP